MACIMPFNIDIYGLFGQLAKRLLAVIEGMMERNDAKIRKNRTEMDLVIRINQGVNEMKDALIAEKDARIKILKSLGIT